jgi:hypothetical protein
MWNCGGKCGIVGKIQNVQNVHKKLNKNILKFD